MKHLFNFSYVPQWPIEGMETESELRKFNENLELDGVELMLYDNNLDCSAYKEHIYGVHLLYWPCWIPLFEGDKQTLTRLFPNQKALTDYYGASSREAWLDRLRKNVQLAVELEPEYLVWHVADCTIDEAFSFNFRRSNREVLQRTVELVRLVQDIIPPKVKLLFENLWWPGLTLVEPQDTNWFLEQLSDLNTGIMLDTGHLLNTDLTAATEAEAIQVLLQRLEAMGSLREAIKGMHLNLSLSAEYRRQCLKHISTDYSMESIMKHIRSIDQHRAFTDTNLRRVVELAEPEYVNHELYYSSTREAAELLRGQLYAARG